MDHVKPHLFALLQGLQDAAPIDDDLRRVLRGAQRRVGAAQGADQALPRAVQLRHTAPPGVTVTSRVAFKDR